jgi:hypothetical protein
VHHFQLYANSIEYIRNIENHQNCLGVYLESDPHPIEVATTLTDGHNGVVVHYCPVFLGTIASEMDYDEIFVDKVICEVGVQDYDVFPRRIAVALAMNQKDGRGGFHELTHRAANRLAEKLKHYVQEEVDAREHEQIALRMGQDIHRSIGYSVGLVGDPFPTASLIYEIPSYNFRPSLDQAVLVFKEPHASRAGEFRMYCNWRLSDTSAFFPSNANSSPGIRFPFMAPVQAAWESPAGSPAPAGWPDRAPRASGHRRRPSARG